MAKVDKDTAMAAVCMVFSRALIYGDKFDFNYKDGVLTTTYESKIKHKVWTTNQFEE